MYTRQNFPTKKALREAVKRGERVTIWQPGPFGGDPPTEGSYTVEGPHYPQPHKWYAVVQLRDGAVVAVR